MIILSSGAQALLEVISVKAINWISQYTSRSKAIKSDISLSKCGKAMASSGNINRGIQLITDVIDNKMLKGKYLVGTLSAHPMRLHNYPMRLLILLCGDKYIRTLKPIPTGIY